MNFDQIILEQRGNVAVLTLNRPDIRNVITGKPMVEQIVAALDATGAEENVRVLIVTGAGSAFSAGGNVKEMAEKTGMFAGSPEAIAENYRMGIQRIPLAFYRFDLPVICAVNGPAIGAGCDLACMGDVRVVSENAKFGETFGTLALVPGDGGAFFLSRAVGYSKACELAFSCRVIDAQEALKIGLVSEVVSPERLMDRAMEMALEIARQPRKTLVLTKRLMRMAQERGLLEVLDKSAEFQGLCHHLPEHDEAVRRFVQKKTGK